MEGRTKNGRVTFIIGLVVLALLSLSAVIWTRTSSSDHAKPVLRVGNQKGGVKSMMTAAGVLNDLPYTIEWSEFPASQSLLEALSADALDLGIAAGAPFQFAYQAGAPLVAIYASAVEPSEGNLSIIVPVASTIRTARDLKGKRIVTGRGSMGEYLLLRALHSAGLTKNDVNLMFLSPNDANAALSSGAADAWSVWSPYIGAAVLHGGARIAIDSKGLANGYVLQISNQTAVKQKRAQLSDFLERYTKALHWSNSHRAEAAAVLSSETGLPLDVAQYALNHQKWRPAAINDRLFADERAMLDEFSKGSGFISKRPIEAAYDRTFQASLRAGR